MSLRINTHPFMQICPFTYLLTHTPDSIGVPVCTSFHPSCHTNKRTNTHTRLHTYMHTHMHKRCCHPIYARCMCKMLVCADVSIHVCKFRPGLTLRLFCPSDICYVCMLAASTMELTKVHIACVWRPAKSRQVRYSGVRQHFPQAKTVRSLTWFQMLLHILVNVYSVCTHLYAYVYGKLHLYKFSLHGFLSQPAAVRIHYYHHAVDTDLPATGPIIRLSCFPVHMFFQVPSPSPCSISRHWKSVLCDALC